MSVACLMVAAGLAATVPQSSQAAVVLTYDNPVIDLTPGQTVDVGATLTNQPGGQALVTDPSGIVQNPFLSFGISLRRQDRLDAQIAGTADNLFAVNTVFTIDGSAQLDNLDLAAGSSIHLDLGTFVTALTLPAGVYTADIGLDASCALNVCSATPFSPPGFADAGLVTFVVGDPVPEPGTAMLLGVGLLGLAARTRRLRG